MGSKTSNASVPKCPDGMCAITGNSPFRPTPFRRVCASPLPSLISRVLASFVAMAGITTHATTPVIDGGAFTTNQAFVRLALMIGRFLLARANK
eukprot:SAG31_NODE_34378_length_333_cov_1.324786_1_plen_93_part_10